MCEISSLLEKDSERSEVLNIVNSLHLPQCYVAAGFLRNMVWDSLHNIKTPLNDIDVVFYNPEDHEREQEKRASDYLNEKFPQYLWEVKNQAFMHQRNGDRPYKSTLDAMKYWPEKETAIGAAINDEGVITIVSAFGIQSLLCGKISFNCNRPLKTFLKRVESKKWLIQWPKLKVVL